MYIYAFMYIYIYMYIYAYIYCSYMLTFCCSFLSFDKNEQQKNNIFFCQYIFLLTFKR